jgi:hypothetical protein
MSNKTQLQTNNTALDALITRVNAAKETAASLPDASGGGSGGVETCTVSCPNWPIRLIYQSPEGTFYDYYDPDGFGEVEFPTSFTVNKNSWVMVEAQIGDLTLTGASKLAEIEYETGSFTALYVIKIVETAATIEC